MEKILKISDSLIQTYQGETFILSILMAHDNVSNLYYNNYINMSIITDDMNDKNISFTNSLWENYRLQGYADMGMYKERNLEKKYLKEFLKERIDQESYLILLYVDEYYISYSSNYHKFHRVHDAYIYGYDDTNYYMMAFSHDNMKNLKIDQKEVTTALISQLKKEGDAFLCTFNVNKLANVQVDLNVILHEMKCYINGEGYDPVILGNRVYGIKIYTVIQEYITFFINLNEKNTIEFDLRIFREFHEHKKIMCRRLEKLKEMIDDIDNQIPLCMEIENLANIIFMKSIKYTITNKKKLLQSISQQLDLVLNKELVLYRNIIHLIENRKV